MMIFLLHSSPFFNFYFNNLTSICTSRTTTKHRKQEYSIESKENVKSREGIIDSN